MSESGNMRRQGTYVSSQQESVSGRSSKGSSLYKASEEYFEYTCDPCRDVGDHLEADGFCLNCNDYLCGMCVRYHSRNKASRDHVLLDKDNMPKKSNVCKTAGSKAEVEGCRQDSDEYLPRSSRSHSRNKASEQNILEDKGNMPRGETLASSVAKVGNDKRDTVVSKPSSYDDYTYIRDFKINSVDDKKDSYIIGMILVSRYELILTDWKNQSLKLYDVKNDVIKGHLKLQSYPVGMTAIPPEDLVAVVLQDKHKMEFISVSGGLSVQRTLNTNGNCVDVKFINGKLYVSFKEPVKFQILQTTGAVYRTIQPDPDVLKYCAFPKYIAVSSDESMIYISDWKTNNVLCVDMNGKMVFRFRGELNDPQYITISPTGSVYVCNREQHVVYKMTPDLGEATVILGRGDGLWRPITLCFNYDKQHLYIKNASRRECDVIKVYKWK